MLLCDAVKRLEETAANMGTEDGDLLFQRREGTLCQFCKGECMAAEFGGRVAEISTPEPFTARMCLGNMYGAPLLSQKTRAAAVGALNAAAGFLMLTRKTGACNSVYHDDCRAELLAYCKDKAVYIIGSDIVGINQTLTSDEADIVLVSGDAFLEDAYLAEIEEVLALDKEVMFIGQNYHGIAALLHLNVWCPYGI
ncbi:MAG TPA: hypothetical protein O0X27_06800 [Methanocorpusculum sp.]|nr:hypothetical protein [Methanocorpusculum sp.]